MKIAVDIDDVMVDTVSGIAEYYNSLFGTHFTIKDHWTFDLPLLWNRPKEEVLKIVYDFYRSPVMDALAPIDGSIRGIDILSKEAEVVFVTSRPGFTQEKTDIWMKKYIPDFNLPIYYTDQVSQGSNAKITKVTICEDLHVSLVIDDAPVYASAYIEKNIPVLLYDRNWNRDLPNTELLTRVHSWNEVLEKVREKKQLNGKA